MKIRAEMSRKRGSLHPTEYEVDKVVELPDAQFTTFMSQPLNRYKFMKRSHVEAHQGDGFDHCLLVLGEGRTDGVLVDSEGGPCARYAAYLPQARALVNAGLERAVNHIVRHGAEHTASGYWCVYFEELEEKFSLTISEGSGLDAMLKDALERRPEVATVEIHDGAIETTFHPEFCAELRGSAVEEKTDIRLRDILPLLTGGGLTFLCHAETEASVQAENLRTLTETGREDHAALLNAKVAEIAPTLEGVEVVLTDVAPEELARFNKEYEAFQAAEQTLGDMTP